MSDHFRYALNRAVTCILVFGKRAFEKELKKAGNKTSGSRVLVFVESL